MTEKIIKIVKRRRVYRSFESHKPRQRSACPICRSVSLKKGSRTKTYRCELCGWTGSSIVKIEY